MISPADLFRAAAQSARAAAVVEIGQNIAGSPDAGAEAPAPETDQQVVDASIIADQIPPGQAQAGGQTLAGLSEPAGGLQSLSFQPGQGGLQGHIAALARQLSTQFLQTVSSAPGQPGGAPIQSAPSNPQGLASLAEAVQAFLSQSPGPASSARLTTTIQPSADVAASSAMDLSPGGESVFPRAGQDVPSPATVSGLGALRDTPDGQSATSSQSLKIGDASESLRSAAAEATVKAREEAAATLRNGVGAAMATEASPNITANAGGLPALDDLRLTASILAQAISGHGGEEAAGGIIASFILNASIIPGWTLPRLPASIEERFADLATRMMETPEVAQADLLAYLANFGGNEQLLERLRKAQLPPTISIKVLGFLAVLMTAITTILSTLRQEAAELLEELTDQELSSADLEPGGKRKRLYLR